MCTKSRIAGALALLWLASPGAALADDAAVTASEFMTNNVWMMLCTALVFIMHLGFASLESGLSRSKNTVNILFKNVFVPLVGLLTHYAFGFALMYPGEFDGVLGFAGFGLTPPENGMTAAYAASHGYTYWTDFLFQAMFAATCATIVSGAVAERIKLWSFMVFCTVFVGFVYTIGGSWKWGGGWLHAAGFHDFAGSTLVHSVGGWGALAGVLGSARGRDDAGPAARQIRPERPRQPDDRQQHAHGDRRGVHALAGMVRL